MSKTITLRIPDNVYKLLKIAAEGEKRSISNFIEYAALNYLTEETFVSDEEMEDLLKDNSLLKNLKQGEKEIKKGMYKIVR